MRTAHGAGFGTRNTLGNNPVALVTPVCPLVCLWVERFLVAAKAELNPVDLPSGAVTFMAEPAASAAGRPQPISKHTVRFLTIPPGHVPPQRRYLRLTPGGSVVWRVCYIKRMLQNEGMPPLTLP